MSNVTRYDPDTVGSYGMFSAVMREEPEGDYVKYDDVVSFMASQSRDLSEAREAIRGLKSMVASLQETYAANLRDAIDEMVSIGIRVIYPGGGENER